MIPLNKILYILLSVSLISMIASGVYAFTSHIKTGATSTTKTLRYNVYSPSPKDDSIRYYTGNTFISYNPKDGSSKPLTNYRYIPDIQTIYWLNDGVIFSFENYSTPNELQKALTASRQNIFNDQNNLGISFWHLSFKDNSLKHLALDQRPDKPFAVYGSGGVIYRETETSYSLVSHDGQIKQSVINNLPAEAQLIGFNESDYYYLESVAERIAVKKGRLNSTSTARVTNDLYSGPDHTALEPVAMDNSSIYYFADNRLMAFNISSGERTALGELNNGRIIKYSSGQISAFSSNGAVISINSLIDGKVSSSQTFQHAGHINPVMAFSSDEVFYVNSLNGELVASSSNVDKLKSYKNGYHDPLEKAVTSQKFALKRAIEAGRDNEYVVTYISGTSSQLLSDLYQQINASGIDPYQLTFSLNPGPRATD